MPWARTGLPLTQSQQRSGVTAVAGRLADLASACSLCGALPCQDCEFGFLSPGTAEVINSGHRTDADIPPTPISIPMLDMDPMGSLDVSVRWSEVEVRLPGADLEVEIWSHHCRHITLLELALFSWMRWSGRNATVMWQRKHRPSPTRSKRSAWGLWREHRC